MSPEWVEATYYGQRVLVSEKRRVAGGYVRDVMKHPDAASWPWTVTYFTVNDDHITLCEPGRA